MTQESSAARSRSESDETQEGLSRPLLILLAMCGGFSPFAVDTYLPGLPQIAQELHTSASMAQITLTAFLIPLVLMQLVIGLLSDQLGRRKLLLVGLVGAFLASVLCAVAPSIEILLLGRFLQGSFGAAAIVLSRAVVADLYTSQKAMAKAFSAVIAVQSVAPAIAPVIGGGG